MKVAVGTNPVLDCGYGVESSTTMGEKIHMKRICVITLLITMSSASFAQDVNRRDGNWWLQQTVVAKLSYMVGFMDGISLGHSFTVWNLAHDKLPNDKAQQECMSSAIQSFDHYYGSYFKTPTNNQVSEGLDVFIRTTATGRFLPQTLCG